MYCIGGYYADRKASSLPRIRFFSMATELFLQEFCLMFTVPVDIHFWTASTGSTKLVMRGDKILHSLIELPRLNAFLEWILPQK